MFKTILFILMMILPLHAVEPDEASMSPLEILMFKIGFTALVEEFEQEKNTTASNTERIAQLEKNFELLVKFMEMTKRELVTENDTQGVTGGGGYGIYNIGEMKKELSAILAEYKKEIESDKSKEISQLKSEVASLKRDIRLLLSRQSGDSRGAEPAPSVQREDRGSLQRFRVVVDELAVKEKASPDAATVTELKRGDRVVFESCDRYGWCRIENRGFVPKHLFLPAE